MAKPTVGPRYVALVRFAAPVVLMIAGGPLVWAQAPPGTLGGPAVPGAYGPPPANAAAPWTPPATAPQDKPEEIVVGVRVEGNRAVTLEKILAEIHTRAGRPYDPELIQSDINRLHKLRMFVHVQALSQRVQGGRVVIFRLIERPILKEVVLQGNVEYKTGTLIKDALKIKKGDAADPYEVEEGRRRLEDFYHKKGYSKVRITVKEGNKPGQLRAVYEIDEGPQQKVWKINVVGTQIVSGQHIKMTIPKTSAAFLHIRFFGGDVDLKEIDEDCKRITAYYRGLGFFQARVGRELEYSADQRWLTITFVVDEGPRSIIRSIGVVGNTRFSNEELMAKLKLAAGKPFDQGQFKADILRIQDKYGTIGYVKADVKGDLRYLDKPGQVDLVYNIYEGERYRIGRVMVQIKGDNPHTQITTVLNRLSFQPGDVADMREIHDSERRLKASGLYLVDPTKGYPPKVVLSKPGKQENDEAEEEPQVAEDPDQPRRGGGYRGQSPDLPGAGTDRAIDVVYQFNNVAEVRRAEQELGISLLPPPSAPPGPSAAWPAPYGTPLPPPSAQPIPQAAEPPMVIRGQWSGDGVSRPELAPTEEPLPPPGTAYTPGPAAGSSPTPPPAAPLAPQYAPPPQYAPQQYVPQQYSPPQYPPQQYPPQQAPSPASPAGVLQPAPISPSGVTGQPWQGPARNYLAADSQTPPPPAPNGYQVPPNSNPYPPPVPAPNGYPAPQGYNPNAPPPAPYGYPPGPAPAGPGGFGPPPGPTGPGALALPPGPIFGPGSNWAEPSPNGEPFGVLDPRIISEESQTGRIMLGVGVNSDAGLVGNIVLDEQNFDWTRWPSSWEDIRDGTAFRGAGEHFRVELVPGTELQRYTISYSQPYLFDIENRAVGMTVSGVYYDRIYDQWTEGREGGRISFGYQLTHDLTASIAFRGYNVNISNPVVPTPLALEQVLGNNALYGFGVSLAHNTRDNDFLATQGHLFEVSFEEVTGSYTYPHVEAEWSQYFRLYERADHTGCRVLSLSARVGFTGDDTPIYERYYAGGYSSLRGFEFRGVSPIDPATGVAVGGDFQLLTTAQYLFPITQDDMLRGVVFVDAGTVEPTVSQWTDRVRVAPGFGLRIAIPAMGPAPIALDFGFPVVKQPGDVTQVFSFFVGFNH
jgi:outer membrane protein insertion porin family